MANRFILNETSYHGAGAIKEIATEITARGFKKSICMLRPRPHQIQCNEESYGCVGLG